MSVVDYRKLDTIFFPFCTKEEERIKSKGIDFAYYCSLDTLFNILNNQELWLRNIRCMSDIKELFFGYNTLRTALYEDKSKLTRLIDALTKIDQSKYGYWVRLFDTAFSKAKVNNLLFMLCKYANIICFTEHSPEDDDNGRLDMFNSYGRGNGGCLVFDAKKVLDTNYRLLKVIYVKNGEDPLLEVILDQLINSIECNIEYLRSIDFTEVKRYMFNVIVYAMASIKQYGFSYEKEWRMIYNSRAKKRKKNTSDYLINCYPVCLNGVPQMVIKESLKGKESLLKRIIIERKFEQMEEKFCLAHLLFLKWDIKKEESFKYIKISDISIKR